MHIRSHIPGTHTHTHVTQHESRTSQHTVCRCVGVVSRDDLCRGEALGISADLIYNTGCAIAVSGHSAVPGAPVSTGRQACGNGIRSSTNVSGGRSGRRACEPAADGMSCTR
eukprot:TRINITY_DN4669_c0_g1_i3.p2 TRINITY_DN4669_c0_g1~~TRINITY_DN4669_c0_g1_i3.p2  ORF type:complete len:112 (+),score=1.13 TRINITY_DN4669_c0_g1_i3:243-578(+)